jgi:hypothetical protein
MRILLFCICFLQPTGFAGPSRAGMDIHRKNPQTKTGGTSVASHTIAACYSYASLQRTAEGRSRDGDVCTANRHSAVADARWRYGHGAPIDPAGNSAGLRFRPPSSTHQEQARRPRQNHAMPFNELRQRPLEAREDHQAPRCRRNSARSSGSRLEFRHREKRPISAGNKRLRQAVIRSEAAQRGEWQGLRRNGSAPPTGPSALAIFLD